MSSDECKPVYRLIEDSIYAPYPQDNEFAEEDSQSRSTKMEQLKESPCSK
jgi:hypothetical protein